MTGREGPGPERPGPDYPPEWDTEPDLTDEEVREVLEQDAVERLEDVQRVTRVGDDAP